MVRMKVYKTSLSHPFELSFCSSSNNIIQQHHQTPSYYITHTQLSHLYKSVTIKDPRHSPDTPKMSYYAAQNPYRNSTGGLNLGRSPPRTQIIIPVRPPSPADSACSSCDSSLPLNTPWSGSGTQLDQTERICTRTRRLSTHSEGRHSDGHHMDGHHHLDSHHDRGRPAPLIIRQGGGPGPLSAPLAQHRGYHSEHSRQALVVPASSIDRHRSASRSRSGYTKYHHAIEHLNDESFEVGSVGSEVGRRGRTRFPRKLVSKEAVEEMGLPWSEESDGALVVLRALDRTEIERLVDLTEEIRRESTVFLSFLR